MELLKKMFELEIKRMWMREVDKAVEKYNRLNHKTNRQGRVVNALIVRYNEIYAHDGICAKVPDKEEPDDER